MKIYTLSKSYMSPMHNFGPSIREADLCENNTNLVYIMSSRPTGAVGKSGQLIN